MRPARLAFYQGLAVGLLLTVSARALLATLFHASLATLRLNPSAFWTLALLAPLLAPLVRGPRVPLALAALCAAALPFVRFTGAHVPVAALAAGSAALALATMRGQGLAGAVAGVALAGGVIVALDSRDLPYFVGGGALALLALFALVEPTSSDKPDPRAGIAWGIVIVLELALLASPYALARHAGIAPWLAALAGLGGLLVGAALLPRAGLWLPVVGAVGALDLALVKSPIVLLSIVALQAALGSALRHAAPPHGAALALTLAPLAFGVTFFLGALPGWGAMLPLAVALAFALTWTVRRATAHPSRGAPVTLVLLVALAVWPAPAGPAPEGREITVVSWNVHQGFGNRGGLDPDLYLDVLRDADADIVLLQETARGELSSGGLDSVLHLAGALGMRAAYGTPGSAVLARYELGKAPPSEMAPWTIEAPVVVDGETVWIQSVHLGRSTSARAAQAQEILAAARERPGARILGGDLNSCPTATCFGGRASDATHATLGAVYADTWTALHDPADPAGHTHPAWNPSRRIDVVMVTGFEVVEARTLRDDRTPLGSDHLPLLVRLRLP